MIPQKLIIFDLDGTLYDLNDVMSMSYQMQIDFFSEDIIKKYAKSLSIIIRLLFFPEGVMNWAGMKNMSMI